MRVQVRDLVISRMFSQLISHRDRKEIGLMSPDDAQEDSRGARMQDSRTAGSLATRSQGPRRRHEGLSEQCPRGRHYST